MRNDRLSLRQERERERESKHSACPSHFGRTLAPPLTVGLCHVDNGPTVAFSVLGAAGPRENDPSI